MTPTPCEQIVQGMGELFECSKIDGYTRIRTPYLYPDGDVIDLYLTEDDGTSTLTDLGETLGWLRSQTVSDRKTTRQRRLIEEVCLTHGVELYKGMLVVRARGEEDLGSAVTRLSQAALGVADLWTTFRGYSAASVSDDVEEFLVARRIGFDRREKLVGRSQRIYTVDFHTRTPQRSALVNVLSTGSRATARRLVEHNVTVWHDLNHLKLGAEPLRFVSLFDDELDVWTPEDFRLVEDLSEVAYWSQKDDFTEMLVA